MYTTSKRSLISLRDSTSKKIIESPIDIARFPFFSITNFWKIKNGKEHAANTLASINLILTNSQNAIIF